MFRSLKGFLGDRRGATAAEYALLLALLASALAVSATALGESIASAMGGASTLIEQSGCDNNGRGTGFGGGNGGGRGQGAGRGKGNSC